MTSIIQQFFRVEWIIFAVGACVGSFLNVCIYRIPAQKSIVSPGSSCPNCHQAIPFYLNIPILSFIVLAGRCRFCRIPISIRYPLIEALTGIFAVLAFNWFGPSLIFVYWFAFICTLITVSFIDLDHQIIPDVISLPGILIFASGVYILPDMTLLQSLAGIFSGGGILYAVAVLYGWLRKQEGMGGGDIKLLAMIGAATGVQGVLFTIFVSSIAGSAAGLVMMVFNRTTDATVKVPFGPFLSLGAILYLFYGESILHWYISLLLQ